VDKIKNRPVAGTKIVIAMSGGVDSSVAAALLKQQGYFVTGVFMKFWSPAGDTQICTDKKTDLHRYNNENRCCSVESEKLARLASKKIGIPFYTINVEKEFKKKVVDYFLSEYKKGNTPNPCVVCNKEIKFGLLIEKALKMGADFIATGHYARLKREIRLNSAELQGAKRLVNNPKLEIRNGDFKLLKGKDKGKDQSYFLWQLNQKQLSHVLFPVGNYTKAEVRKLAKKFKLPTAQTSESQEVCFVSGTTNEFLKKYLKPKPGNIVDKTLRHGSRQARKILGRHEGLHFYTIGQRKGIGLGGSASAKGSGETKPYYVVAKDLKNNNLIVSRNKKDLESKELIAKNVNWISGSQPKLPAKVLARIRYRHDLAEAIVSKFQASSYELQFKHPQQAVTPGQSVVFYSGKELLGGGIIY